ncbi:MAG: hypothetical protein QM811_02720 [Pirellulales bacterium]
MNSFLAITSTDGVITISNLGSAYTANGYKVVAFFNIGALSRNYGLRVDDGTTSATYFTNDTAVDSDPTDSGAMTWLKATGVTSGTATSNANYAVFDGLNASSFNITGIVGVSGRSIISGFQVIANPVAVPEPGTYGLLAFACALAWGYRGKYRRTA